MLKDWTKNPTYRLAEVDIIDIKSHAELESNWQDFFVNHHYRISNDIYSSYLFQHPRRSCDAFSAATLMLDPWPDKPFPKFKTLPELQSSVAPLLEEEERHSRDKSGLSAGASMTSL